MGNSVKINLPSIGPIKLSSSLESYTQETFTTACEIDGMLTPGALCGDNAIEYKMGHYNSPPMAVTPGDNYDDFNVVMTSNSATILSAWVIPLWISGQKTHLIIKAKDIKVKVLGITFSGLTMRNVMTCRGVTGSPSITVPNSVCYPDDPKHEPYETQTYMAICEPGEQSLAPTTTTDAPSTTAVTAATVIA